MLSTNGASRSLLTVLAWLLICVSGNATASEFLFRSNSDDGQIYSVRTDGTRGKYRWYLGVMGEFEARISRGTRISLSKSGSSGSIGLDKLGDVVLKINGESSPLQEGSFGFQCYVETLKHHGVYRPEDFVHEYIYRDVGQ